MNKKEKINVFFIALFFLFFFPLIGKVYASVQSNWQTTWSASTTNFLWNKYSPNEQPTTAVDSEGLVYASANSAFMYLVPMATTQTGLGLDSGGWKIWEFGRNDLACGEGGRYIDYNGGAYYLYSATDCVDVGNFAYTDGTMYVRKWDGLDNSSVNNLEIYGGFGTTAYIVVYTDEDLSYINTTAEFIAYYNSLNEAPPPPDYSTRFISYYPTLGTTTPNATSTNFKFGATGYISSSDFATSSTELYIRWRQFTGQNQRGNSWIGESGSFTIQATTSGNFDLSTTSQSVTATGAYLYYAQLRVPLFSIAGFGFFHKTLKETVGSFVVGTDTPANEINQADFVLESNLGQAVGLVESDAIIPADETNASSSLISMIRFMGLKNTILSKFPISWVTESATILTYALEHPTSTSFDSNSINLSLNFGDSKLLQNVPTTTPLNTTLSFFSTSTLQQASSITAIQSMRTLLSWVLWFGLIEFAWIKVKKIFTPKET